MNDESGVLVEGYDREPFVKQPWHPPYYQRLCEEAGLDKAVDLLMWELVIDDREKILPIIFELAEQVGPKHGIRLRKMTRRSLRRDLDGFAEVYNAAWSQQLGLRRPTARRTSTSYAQELQLVFDPAWFMVAERETDGEIVGVAITVPDINQVLRRMNGRLLPARLVALPAPPADHRPRARRLPRASSPSTSTPGSRPGSSSSTSTRPWSRPFEVGRDGLDPRDQPRHEPGHGGDGRAGRQALPRLRDASSPGARLARADGRQRRRARHRHPARRLHGRRVAALAQLGPDVPHPQRRPGSDPAADVPRARGLADRGQPDRRRA